MMILATFVGGGGIFTLCNSNIPPPPKKKFFHIFEHTLSQIRKPLLIFTTERLSFFHTKSQYLTWCQ